MSAVVAGAVVLLTLAGVLASTLRRRGSRPANRPAPWDEPTTELPTVGPVSTQWDGDVLVHAVGGRPVAAMARETGTAAAWWVRDLAHPHRTRAVVGGREVAQAACWDILDDVRRWR